jgi:hypothetical protein
MKGGKLVGFGGIDLVVLRNKDRRERIVMRRGGGGFKEGGGSVIREGMLLVRRIDVKGEKVLMRVVIMDYKSIWKT